MKRAAVVLVAALVLGTMAGCPTGPSSSGASGTVADRKAWSCKGADPCYSITVKEDGGKRSTGRVSGRTYKRCQVGDRWPECKR